MKSIRDRILQIIGRRDYSPIKPGTLLKRLKLRKKEVETFWNELDDLLDAGTVREDRAGRLKRRTETASVTGIIRRTGSGHGTFSSEGPDVAKFGAEINVPRDDMGTAYTGDRVRLQVSGRRGRGGLRNGRVVEIVERASHTFVGTCIQEHGDRISVQVVAKVFAAPFRVEDARAAGAHAGDKVVIEVLRFPEWGSSGDAVITEVLDESRVDIDVEAARLQFGLPSEFPEAVNTEARKLTDRFDPDEIGDRLDLRDACILTIDPGEARDFDDAISLERRDDGSWRLGVHIADVGHFVRPGSRLDNEARARATSVYLPKHVIPMFPPALSNGLASLQQGQVRFTKSAFIEFNSSGGMKRTEFFNTAICVKQRLTYEQAAAHLGLEKGDKPEISGDIAALLGRMYELSRILRARRLKGGALDLVLSETQLVFDDKDKVTGAILVGPDESHQIIEEFMLAANIAVAKALSQQRLAFLRRVHMMPSERKLKDFSEFAGVLGFRVSRQPDRQHILKLLEDARDTQFQTSISFGLLRSLKRAEYSPEEIGHFALNVEDYCHFTSPIRRYPDLTVHRLFEKFLVRKQNRGKPDPDDVRETGRQCSQLERRAERAERDVIKAKLLRLVEPMVGQTWETVVTGVERFGIFCQGTELPAEGLLPIESMNDDIYDFDVEEWCIVGRRSDSRIRIGSTLSVVIDSVDVDQREMRLKLPGEFRSSGNSGRPNVRGGQYGNSNSGSRRDRNSSQSKRKRASGGKKNGAKKKGGKKRRRR